MRDVQIDARATGGSFNNLSNNAYQAGQAFEDFAVGFSLNGLAGGIRGAANNVAFILNDMSRLPGVTNFAVAAVQKMRPALPLKEAQALGAKYASMIPLAAGIGSALAIVVLPRMVEWLQSLNDIDSKFEDIADIIKSNFAGQDVAIKLKLDNSELKRDLESAESVAKIIERIRDIDFDVSSKQQQLSDIFQGFETKEFFGDTNTPFSGVIDQIKQFNGDVEEQIKKTEARKKRYDIVIEGLNQGTFEILNPGVTSGGFVQLAEDVAGIESYTTQLLALKGFKAELFAVKRAIETTVESGKDGIVNKDALILAQRQIESFSKFITENVGRIDLGPEAEAEAKKITAALATMKDRFEEIGKLSGEIGNTIEKQFLIAFDAASKKVDELEDKLRLTRSVAAGVNIDFDVELLDLNTQIAKGRRLVDEVIQAGRDKAKKSGVVIDERVFSKLEEENNLQSLLSLEQARAKAKQELIDLDEKGARSSKSTQFEEYARQLQLNALDKESLKEKTDRANKIENIARMDRNIAEFNAGKDGSNVALQARPGKISLQEQEERKAAAFKEAMREIFQPLQKIVDSQDKTTDAVKKIPGAVAQ